MQWKITDLEIKKQKQVFRRGLCEWARSWSRICFGWCFRCSEVIVLDISKVSKASMQRLCGKKTRCSWFNIMSNSVVDKFENAEWVEGYYLYCLLFFFGMIVMQDLIFYLLTFLYVIDLQSSLFVWFKQFF